jgi:hypothetical protein
MIIGSLSRRPRVFSGIQPSRVLHFSNYLGALKQSVADQDESDLNGWRQPCLGCRRAKGSQRLNTLGVW